MKARICWRTPASSGSNQSSPSNGTAASKPVFCSMAWSPTAVIRPPVEGFPTLRRLRRPPISYQPRDATPADPEQRLVAGVAVGAEQADRPRLQALEQGAGSGLAAVPALPVDQAPGGPVDRLPDPQLVGLEPDVVPQLVDLDDGGRAGNGLGTARADAAADPP